MTNDQPLRYDAATAKQKRVWDKSAPGYDKQIVFFERIWFGGGREWLAGRVSGRVLEVGFGTGRNLAHYPTDLDLSAIELSPAMLDLARSYAEELGRRVDMREGDAADLPWPQATFDTVVCALSLCSIPQPTVAIAEMHRVLKPGGQLLLLDHIGSTNPALRGLQWLVERVTIPLMGEHFTRRQLPYVEQAGFRVNHSERLKAGTIERIDATKAG